MSDRLVNLTSFGTVEEAHLAKNALEAEGLHAFLDGEASIGNLWHLGNAMGGVKLMVPEDEIPRAQEILQRDDDEPGAPDTNITSTVPEAPEPETAITNVRPEPETDIEDSDADLRRDAGPDLEEPQFNSGEVLVNRAFKSAVFAFFVPLLFFYSFWVVYTVYQYEGELDERSQRKFFWALVLNGVILLELTISFGVIFR